MIQFEFNKLPINTLFGSRWANFIRIIRNHQVDKAYRKKYYLTKALCRLLSVTHPIEEYNYHKKAEPSTIYEHPVFILGHWRSGTTYVHNVLAQDKHFGYTTTYQTVLPNAVVWGQPFYKWIIRQIMPDRRPSDKMELKPDQPQEEEFALCNTMPYSFYNFWLFPKSTLEYCEKYMLFNTISQEELWVFQQEFIRLIKTAMYNTGGRQFLSKNPPHTGRVKELIKMFPNAKFIYLVRNPYSVFESSRRFFTRTIQPLKLQDFTKDEMEQTILEVYKRLLQKYEADKHLIPKGHLVEIRFEDFEAEPFHVTQQVYQKLSLGEINRASEKIKRYIDRKKSYRKTEYKYAPQTIQKVTEHWGFSLDEWGYEKL